MIKISVKNRNNRKGGIAIILLSIVIMFVLAVNSVMFIERKTVSIKRQNIHNAVLAANLASYYAVEQGDPNILNFNPVILNNYIKSPDTIVQKGLKLNDIINMSTSEYFKSGEKYKSIFLNQEKAYNLFSDYLKDNLSLVNDSESYSFIPKSSNNSGDIKKLKVKSFAVYNAIYKDMKTVSLTKELQNENRKYTGIHLELVATIYHTSQYEGLDETVDVPIHIDTEITLFRPTIK